MKLFWKKSEKNVSLYNYIGFLRVPEPQSVVSSVRNFFEAKKLSSRILRPEWSQDLPGFQVHFEVLKIWNSKFSESLIVRMSRIHPRNFEELWRTLSNLFANPFKMSKNFQGLRPWTPLTHFVWIGFTDSIPILIRAGPLRNFLHSTPLGPLSLSSPYTETKIEPLLMLYFRLLINL